MYYELCKRKGIRLSLTWFAPRKTWKKKINGKPVYFKFPNTAKGYSDALAAFAKWKEDHEKPADPDGQRDRLERMLAWYQLHGEPEAERGATTELETALQSVQRVMTNSEAKYQYPAWWESQATIPIPYPRIRSELDQFIKWRERFRVPARPTRRKIGDYITMFLEGKLAQVQGGKRKAGTYGDLAERFKWFRKFVGDLTLDGLDEALLTNWYNHVIRLPISGLRQRNLFRAATMLAKWVNVEGYTNKRPSNIDKQWEFAEHLKNGQRVENLAAKLFTKEDMAMMLKKLPPIGRACVLLGLNCAFTAADIAALRKDQVNLKVGRIIYSRVKTVRVKHAPIVNYKLWTCTVEALQATQSKSDTLWFLTKQGQPLKTSTILDGRHRVWSVLSRQWQRWMGQNKVPKGKPFMMLRKTGSTTLGDSTYRLWRILYLADQDENISRFYDIKSGKIIPELDKAIKYLGEQFGLK